MTGMMNGRYSDDIPVAFIFPCGPHVLVVEKTLTQIYRCIYKVRYLRSQYIEFLLPNKRLTGSFGAYPSILGASGIVGGGSMYFLLGRTCGAAANRATISGGSGPRKLFCFFSLLRMMEGVRVWVSAGRADGVSTDDGVQFGFVWVEVVTGKSYSAPSSNRIWCCLCTFRSTCADCGRCVG